MKKLTALFSALVALIFSVSAQSQITPPYYNPANVNITGGNINGTVIGGTTPAAGTFTTVTQGSGVTGHVFRDYTAGDAASIYNGAVTPSATNYAFATNATTTSLNATSSINAFIGGASGQVFSASSTGLNVSNGKTLSVGSGSGTSAGLIAGYYGTSSYGALWGTAVTPASNNFALVTNGATTATNGTSNNNLQINNVNKLLVTSTNITFVGDMIHDKTITTAGTTGNQTINKTTGRVNFAAAATSLVVTNSLVTANSIVHCTVATNDTTMKSASCVPAAGSFTIRGNAAPTAETAVAFTVTN